MNYQIFWGGADVCPEIYGHKRSSQLGGTIYNRDRKELTLAQVCLDKHIPMIGICRGAQLLNVFNNGVLVQHINNHTKHHTLQITEESPVTPGELITCNSTHHQMMVPARGAQVLAVCPEETTGVDMLTDAPTKYKEVYEILYYPKTKSLCIQAHPEWMPQDSAFVTYCNKLIKHFFNLSPIDFAKESL
jgi:putative glutamine amidotransferase